VAAHKPLAFELVPFTADSQRINDAISVYASVYRQDVDRSRQAVRDAATRDGFVGRLALLDGEAVAMGYGAVSKVGHWWYETIAEALGPDYSALQSSWNLVELGVLPSFRRRGLATALLDDLLMSQPYPRALLSVIVHNAAARTLYENRGWRYLHPT
jgi:ribosomal protein S18 acetylase RimI-like enzyme